MKILSFAILAFSALTMNYTPLYSQEVKTSAKQEKSEQQQQVEYTSYSNNEKKYEISYPQNWQKLEAPEQFDLVLLAPPRGTNSNTPASINIISQYAGPSLTLENFFKENIPNVINELKEAKIESTGDLNINGIETKRAIYTHVINGISLKVLQYFIIEKGYAYLITFTSTTDDFPLYKEDFEKVVSTFHLVKNDSKPKPETQKPVPSKTNSNGKVAPPK